MAESSGYAQLPPAARAAVDAASRVLNEADLVFVLIAAAEREPEPEAIVAVVSNIEPKHTIGLLEGSLKAARAGVGAVDMEERLQ